MTEIVASVSKCTMNLLYVLYNVQYLIAFISIQSVSSCLLTVLRFIIVFGLSTDNTLTGVPVMKDSSYISVWAYQQN